MVTSESVLRSEPDYRFDFCGGHLALDFTNTVGSRGSDPDSEEHLLTYGDLLAWAEARKVVSHAEAARLKRRAAADPDAARRALRRAIDLREALYAVLARAAGAGSVDPSSLARLNRYVADTFGAAQLTAAAGRLTLATPADEGLDAMLAPVVRAAVDLLTSDAIARVGRCADDTCAWLFLDTTRSRTRRWCDMKSCGNRNKVRRFREAL
jgi:predicted RNA-binding Zn ribbon-like protein